MAIAYRCNRSKGLTCVVWNGRTSAAEWIESSRRQFNDPEWPAGELYISDVRSAIMPIDDIAEILDTQAQRYRDHIRIHLKLALLGTTSFELPERFQQAMTKLGFQCVLFTSLETACQWLGLELRETEALLNELHASLRTKSS